MPDVTASADMMSPLNLFLHADFVVKAVMLGLLAASIWTWAIIFTHALRLKRIRKATAAYETEFWASNDIDTFHTRRGADLFIRETGNILLQEIDEPAFLLKCRKNKQPGSMCFLLRDGPGSFNLRFRFLDYFEQLACERRVAEHLKGKAQALKKAGLLFYLTSHTAQRLPQG